MVRKVICQLHTGIFPTVFSLKAVERLAWPLCKWEGECLLGTISELLRRLAPFSPKTSVVQLELPQEVT